MLEYHRQGFSATRENRARTRYVEFPGTRKIRMLNRRICPGSERATNIAPKRVATRSMTENMHPRRRGMLGNPLRARRNIEEPSFN